ncbi:dTDP-4-dehydrorhamnose 3,5-epimerase [Morganella sp. B601]|uniref:dTDP-4-dehydrorhamnose 3,5-epimerase n=1 Tax=Morganella sp. B601 TaxID=3444315 RepID=UPI003EBD00A7
MDIIESKLKGCMIIEPTIYYDERGFFYESYQQEKYKKIGIKETFIQDNRSRSSKNVLRGLHFQKQYPQGKLVTVTMGKVLDIAVDLRPNSPTFGEYESVILTDENKLQFYVPPGFAHGFCVLSDIADFAYKCTDYYVPTDECGIRWDDPTIGIKWPINNPVLSEKDLKQPFLKDIEKCIINGWE